MVYDVVLFISVFLEGSYGSIEDIAARLKRIWRVAAVVDVDRVVALILRVLMGDLKRTQRGRCVRRIRTVSPAH